MKLLLRWEKLLPIPKRVVMERSLGISVERVVPCQCLDGHVILKIPLKNLRHGSPAVDLTSFSICLHIYVPSHTRAVRKIRRRRTSFSKYFTLYETVFISLLKKLYDITYCVLSMDRWTNQPVAVDS